MVTIMYRDPNTIDYVTRRLIQAAEKDLRECLHVPKLEQELVAILYLRLRHLIEAFEDDGVVDEIALSIYLTASAWHATEVPAIAVLPSLHKSIADTLNAAPSPLLN